MEKESIFKQIDALYTKAVKIIIAEGSEESDTLQTATKDKTTSAPSRKIGTLKETVSNVKQSLLSIGTPNEKEILYKEVVKREKEEAKEATKLTREKAKALKVESKTKVTPSQKTTTKTTPPSKKSTTSKKQTKPVQKSKNTATPKPVAKKTSVSKTKTDTIKKATPKKTAEKKEATVKKSPAKKSLAKKTAATKTSPAKKTTTKSADAKSTAKKETVTNSKSPSSKTTKVAPKKTTTKKTTTTETKTKTPKAKAAPRGAKKAAKIALYIKDIKKHYGEVDEEFVAIVVNNLGPSIYKKDAELVSCSDPKELDTVRKNFLIKKLGIDASKGVLDAAIQDVCTELKATRTKYRATFYYTLAKKFKKESVLH